MTWQLIIIPIIALLVSQLIKLATNEIKGDFNFRSVLTSYGGMPSSHAAFVASLTTLIGLHSGIFSSIFAVVLIFSLLVLRDAVGLRFQISKQAQILQYLMDKLTKEEKSNLPRLKMRIGHTPMEVIIGCLVGILIALWGYFLI